MRALIVDDERLARTRLRRLLAERNDVEVIGAAEDGDEAVSMIDQLRPDLLFLDIQLPGLSGFDVLAAIAGDPPFIIFTTAFDQYAVRAFEVHALDYLLKPFDGERLHPAVDRAIAMIRGTRSTSRFLEELAPKSIERFVVRHAGRIVFVAVEQIDWIEAADNYVYLHAGSESHLIRGSLKTIESRLGPNFVRIHRSAIVNLERIRELQPSFHGEFTVVLEDGAQLTSSRNYGEPLRRLVTARI